MPRCASACALLLFLGACGDSAATSSFEPAPDPADDDDALVLTDGDADGLCDFTEEEFGTNADAVDTDGDGLPDVTELINGLDPTDPEMPVDDQLGYLEARLDGSLEFPVRATIDGDGQGFSGYFQPLAAVYADGLSAADFFAGAAAVSAHPVDAVRGINQGSAHFADVLGKTRLGFSLRFEYPDGELGVDCARSYPFRYAIKSDDGEIRTERLYLLIVVPEGRTAATGDEHCLPHSCQ